jgi:hypothetical protein
MARDGEKAAHAERGSKLVVDCSREICCHNCPLRSKTLPLSADLLATTCEHFLLVPLHLLCGRAGCR